LSYLFISKKGQLPPTYDLLHVLAALVRKQLFQSGSQP